MQIYLTLQEVCVMWKQKYQSVHIVYISYKKHWKLYCCAIYKYYLWCVYFFCCNKKTSQHIPSVIIYFFSVLDFNFSENNMFQKLKTSSITQTFVLKPCIFLKDGEFWKCFNFIVFDEFISFLLCLETMLHLKNISDV